MHELIYDDTVFTDVFSAEDFILVRILPSFIYDRIKNDLAGIGRFRKDLKNTLLQLNYTQEFLYSSLVVNYLSATSMTDFARPAIPWISDGMMIFVAFPSAAFANASKLFN